MNLNYREFLLIYKLLYMLSGVIDDDESVLSRNEVFKLIEEIYEIEC